MYHVFPLTPPLPWHAPPTHDKLVRQSAVEKSVVLGTGEHINRKTLPRDAPAKPPRPKSVSPAGSMGDLTASVPDMNPKSDMNSEPGGNQDDKKADQEEGLTVGVESTQLPAAGTVAQQPSFPSQPLPEITISKFDKSIEVIEPEEPASAVEEGQQAAPKEGQPAAPKEPVSPAASKEPVPPAASKEPVSPAAPREPAPMVEKGQPAAPKEPVSPAAPKELVSPAASKEPVSVVEKGQPAAPKESVSPAASKELVSPAASKEPVSVAEEGQPAAAKKPVSSKEPVSVAEEGKPAAPVGNGGSEGHYEMQESPGLVEAASSEKKVRPEKEEVTSTEVERGGAANTPQGETQLLNNLQEDSQLQEDIQLARRRQEEIVNRVQEQVDIVNSLEEEVKSKPKNSTQHSNSGDKHGVNRTDAFNTDADGVDAYINGRGHEQAVSLLGKGLFSLHPPLYNNSVYCGLLNSLLK